MITMTYACSNHFELWQLVVIAGVLMLGTLLGYVIRDLR